MAVCVQRSDRLQRWIYSLLSSSWVTHPKSLVEDHGLYNLFHSLVKLFITSTHTVHSQSPASFIHFFCFAKPLIKLPQMDTSRGSAPVTLAAKQTFLCLPFPAILKHSGSGLTHFLCTMQPVRVHVHGPDDDGRWVQDDFPMGPLLL